MKKYSLFFNAKLLAAGLLSFAFLSGRAQTTFSYTGGLQTYTVPAGITSIRLEAWGAQGQGGNGGLGGYSRGDMTVTPGQVLNIYVGGQAGYNGGGIGHAVALRNGGGGSDVRISPYAIANRVIVAGGGGAGGPTDVGIRNGGGGGSGTVGANYAGGGGGDGYGGNGGPGGVNGGTGNTSCHSGGAGGGGLNSGGAPSCNTCYTNTCGQAGTLGQGGNADVWENGICYTSYGGTNGGGGGYYGGGGSSVGNCGGGGGGGGSSWVGTLTNTILTGGIRTLNGQIIITPLAVAGAALNFDGANDFVSVPASPALNALGSGFTLEAWVNPSNVAPAISIIRKTGDYNMYIAGGTLRAEVWPISGNPTVNFYTGTTAIVPGVWTHVAIVWNGTTCVQYVNGVLDPNSVTTGSIAGSENMFIGISSLFGNPFPGSMDEVRVWNRALCQSEIQNNRTCEIATTGTGLVTNYHFNHGTAGANNAGITTLVDATGNGNSGTLSNFTLNGASSNWIAPGGVTSGVSCGAFVPPVVTVSAVSQTNISCFGGSNGAASVSASGGSGFSYNWTPGNPTGDGTASVTGLTAGTWTCTVTNNCGGVGTRTFSITQPAAALVASAASQTNISCNAGNNGAASVTVSGGTTAYSYNWTPGNPTGDGTASVTGLTVGTWTCTVTDANLCTTSQTFNITQPTALVASALSQTNISCNAGSNGAASVSVTGGTTAYSYNWTPGNPTGDGTASVTGLTAGTWTCTVTDANACVTTRTFNITQPTALVASALSQTNISCNGGSNGSATVSVSGGNPGYFYNWIPAGGNAATATGLSAGIYTCQIFDMNTCVTSQTFNITQPAPLVVNPASQTNISCFGGSNGAASINTPTGGTPAYSYNWTPGNPTGDGTASVTGLTAGTWTCTVTDANSCATTQTFNITAPSALVASAASQTNISCNVGSNGAASVTVSGGTTAYTYNWTPGNPTGDGTASVTGLTAGTWTCTVTDANSCVTTQTFNITAPSALVASAASQTNISCFGGSNGAASVTVSGGTTAYSYNWTPGNPTGDGTASVTGLTVGTWTCTVTDANSCVTTQTFNITAPSVLVASAASQTNILCNAGSNGAAAVSVTGGTTAYSYNWTPGNPTGDGTASVTGLTAGTWTCTVTDANSCVTTQTFNITQPISLSTTGTSTNISCFGGSNGSITVTPVGGTVPYTYAWSPSGGSGATATGLGVGTYTCVITDANGCITSYSVAITQPTVLAATDSITDITCFGQSNGAATVFPTGGTGPYTYTWSPSGGNAATASGLSGGMFFCTITDANGCIITQTVNINEPSVLSATTMQTNVSCNSGSNGDAMVMVSGGTGPYTYAWLPSGGNSAMAMNLSSGTYTCTITDANGCTNTQTFNITQPGSLTATASATTISCNGGNATVTVVGAGGTSPYTGTGTFTVTAGTYSYTVTDANGCTNTTSITVTEPTALTATATATAILCNGGNAPVTVTGAGGTAPYTGEGSFSVTAGTYSYTVTDANGCTTSTSITITEPTAISTTVVSVNVGCNGDSTGSIDLTVTGGTGPYTFDWNSGTYTTEDLTGLGAGTYIGVLTDANGCTDGGTIVISEPAVLVATVTTTVDPDSCGATTGSIDITVSGGTTGYSYLWSNAATTEDLTGVGAGAYSCVVTDTNGCTANVSGSLNDPNAPTVTLALTVDTLCSTDAAFTLTGESPAGGTFSGPGVTAGTFDPAVAGVGVHTISYTFTDSSGCTGSTTDSIFVDVCTSSDVWNLTSDFSIFPNPNNGTFTLQLNSTSAADVTIYDAQGKLVYTQKVQPNVATPMNIESSGMYMITVIDANGGRTSQRVMVTK